MKIIGKNNGRRKEVKSRRRREGWRGEGKLKKIVGKVIYQNRRRGKEWLEEGNRKGEMGKR